MQERNNRVTITRPFVSWYKRVVYFIDPTRKGSVSLCNFLEEGKHKEQKTFLCDVYVEKPFRNKGIASRCIRAAKHYCQREGIAAVYLWCLKDKIKFYEQFGFEDINRTEIDTQGRQQHLMLCSIHQPKQRPQNM